MRTNLFFFLPVNYFIHTRISSFAKLISWNIIYVIPVFWILFYFSDLSLATTVGLFFFQLLLVYNLYEIGYIENDTETIKKEVNPTLRLNAGERQFYEQNKILIYAIRGLWALACLFIISILTSDKQAYFIYTAIALSLVPIYLIYNRIRNRFTLVLHFMLVTIRFLSYPLIFKDYYSVNSLLLLLVFPVINLLERASQTRFGYKGLQFITSSDWQLNRFRMVYYCSFTIAAGVVNLLMTDPAWWIFYLFLYYAVYRTAIFFTGKK